MKFWIISSLVGCISASSLSCSTVLDAESRLALGCPVLSDTAKQGATMAPKAPTGNTQLNAVDNSMCEVTVQSVQKNPKLALLRAKLFNQLLPLNLNWFKNEAKFLEAVTAYFQETLANRSDLGLAAQLKTLFERRELVDKARTNQAVVLQHLNTVSLEPNVPIATLFEIFGKKLTDLNDCPELLYAKAVFKKMELSQLAELFNKVNQAVSEKKTPVTKLVPQSIEHELIKHISDGKTPDAVVGSLIQYYGVVLSFFMNKLNFTEALRIVKESQLIDGPSVLKTTSGSTQSPSTNVSTDIKTETQLAKEASPEAKAQRQAAKQARQAQITAAVKDLNETSLLLVKRIAELEKLVLEKH